MLLNEFLKEHRVVQDLNDTVTKQEATIARLEAAMEQQAVQIQKVSAQVAADRSAPRVISTRD